MLEIGHCWAKGEDSVRKGRDGLEYGCPVGGRFGNLMSMGHQMLLKMGYEYYGDGYEYYGDCLRVALNKCLIDSEISERSVRLMITVSIGKRG